jgi:hypothetical protein
MKLFIADKAEKGYRNENDYHWCASGDILMFGQFQTGNGNPSEVSMCAILDRKFTTHIIVKEVNINRDFLTELMIDSIEKAYNLIIEPSGWFFIEIGGIVFDFNIDAIVQEIIDKASVFNDGQKVICKGRNIFPYKKK